MILSPSHETPSSQVTVASLIFFSGSLYYNLLLHRSYSSNCKTAISMVCIIINKLTLFVLMNEEIVNATLLKY